VPRWLQHDYWGRGPSLAASFQQLALQDADHGKIDHMNRTSLAFSVAVTFACTAIAAAMRPSFRNDPA